jgi:hypothetical protein
MDHWIGKSDNGPIVMWIKVIFKFRGFSLDLHKFVAADDPGCFHTHPAKAWRLVIWGGYWEEVLKKSTVPNTGGERWKESRWHQACAPGFMGMIAPEFCHRIASLYGPASYSLWLRWPVTHKILLIGEGWPEERRSYLSPIGDEQ